MSEELNKTLIHIAIIIAIAAVLLIISRHMIGPMVRQSVKKAKGETRLDERKREDTIITIMHTTAKGLIWIFTICAILAALGVNVTALLTGAGIIGVFVGLSAQNTVKDFLAGFFILIEQQYRVGDIVKLTGGTTGASEPTGTVEEITLRITKLRDDSGKLITVRNGEPTVIINQTATYASIVLDLNFTYESDMALAEKVINKVGEELMKDVEWAELFSVPIAFTRIDNFTDAGVIVRVTGMVAPASQWKVAGEYRRRLLVSIAKQPKLHLAHSASA